MGQKVRKKTQLKRKKKRFVKTTFALSEKDMKLYKSYCLHKGIGFNQFIKTALKESLEKSGFMYPVVSNNQLDLFAVQEPVQTKLF